VVLAVLALLAGLTGSLVGSTAVAASAAVSTSGAGGSPGSPVAPPHAAVSVPAGAVHAAGGGPGGGYWLAGADGGIYSFGTAQFYGSAGGGAINAPVVGITPTADGRGYWEVASDGGIFAYGDATFYGSTGGLHLNKPIVGMTVTPDGRGYWLVASDGGIFAFGDAAFYGSTGGLPLNAPIVGMASTPDGGGYWLVASDGGIFAFGDAGFFGSTGGLHLNKPVVGIASTADGGGYWLVASDGGLFAFGDAGFFGSTGGITLNKPIVAMAASLDGQGYWLVASDGGIFAFGDAGFFGSTGGTSINAPIVGIAPVPNYGTKITSGEVVDISCPTTTWCTAIDNLGDVINYSNGTWSAPLLVDPGSAANGDPGDGGLNSISCPTTTFCLAVSYLDGYTIYNGTSWTPMVFPTSPFSSNPDGGLTEMAQSVSCSSPTYCAVSNFPSTDAQFYINGVWYQPGTTDNSTVPSIGGQGNNSISCVGTFCMTVDNGDQYQTSVGGVLSPAQIIDPAQAGDDGSFAPLVSCVSSTSCEVVFAAGGQAEWWNGTSFTNQGDLSANDPNGLSIGLDAVSCVGTFCAAVDDDSYFTNPNVTNGTPWSGLTEFVPDIGVPNESDSLSCPSATLCQVGTRGGYVYPLNL
jgi:hypothetical protein